MNPLAEPMIDFLKAWETIAYACAGVFCGIAIGGMLISVLRKRNSRG